MIELPSSHKKRVQNRTPYKYKVQVWEEMYRANLSALQIAKLLDIPRNQIQRYISKLGIARTPRQEARLHTRESSHWRTMRNRAVSLWIEVKGEIPLGYHIHHIDNDYTNNSIDNLKCIKGGEHTRLHLSERKHCKHGHKLEPDNIQYEKTSKGYVLRRCKTCRRGKK
jgi:HNH endonuclease